MCELHDLHRFGCTDGKFVLLILSAHFELGAECLPLGGLRLPGSALQGR